MTLEEYMDKRMVDDGWIADHIGIDRSHVSRLRRRVVNPSLPVALAIERLSGGAVPCREQEMIEPKK